MIGIDVISINRIETFIEKHKERALKRYLSPSEISLVKYPKTAAGFWAAKEAISKALGCGIGKELSFHDIIITKTAKGAPKAELSQKAKEAHRVSEISISITHDSGLAIAVCAIGKY